MSTSETRVEWRVESETTEDDFGADESAARAWLLTCAENPDWEPAVLMRREVTVSTTDWVAEQPTPSPLSENAGRTDR